ncbi:MAG: phenylalanine--tRNA ligase subunit alpha [Deltaproteobacteria bacterium RBG_13_65_10]|jgi:phenylalanyl-tRNA synthetase alpha chain|nr:MAG: phenylalanine--tRNA ligase subunit alpha [Deltaproteobacteria bacterium RBG_13_65_10]
MIDALNAIREEALARLSTLGPDAPEAALRDLRARYLGRGGALTVALREMGKLSPQERPRVGKVANEVKEVLEAAFDGAERARATRGRAARMLRERVDVTLPGRRAPIGRLHPVTQIAERAIEVFVGLGFSVVEGPDVESDYYNFEALNIPKGHPARELQDTFYVTDDVVLRTHTSPVQIRTMKRLKPPLRVIAPGTVYRRDDDDVTHSPMFYQIEGFMVDRGVTFGDLKGILTAFVQELFGHGTRVSFRPSYFPFVEPGAELDIECFLCKARGCRVCKGSGWLEILGAGMIHPEVFRAVNYDPEVFSGFAFGMGIERIAMLRYGVNNIRLFYENDQRFLEQF